MNRLFVEMPLFNSRWKAMGLGDSDLARLESELLANPKVGAVMQGTGGVRKMRFSFEDKGKSGSARVIYIDFEVYEKIYLMTAYPKNEKADLTNEERVSMKRAVKLLEQQLSENSKGREL